MTSKYTAKGTLGRNGYSDSQRRPIVFVVGPSIAYVELTQGKFSTIECDDADIVGKFNWSAHRDLRTGRTYAYRAEWIDGKRVQILLHRFIFPDGGDVDHRNRSTLDNRKHNLRAATRAQNAQNKGISKNNSLGVKGVDKRRNNKYRAKITVSGRRIHLGSYDLIEDASKAYQDAAIKYFGEFACFDSLG